MDWKLLPEKKMIKGYDAKKAELDLEGDIGLHGSRKRYLSMMAHIIQSVFHSLI
jgi:hypothetical protein